MKISREIFNYKWKLISDNHLDLMIGLVDDFDISYVGKYCYDKKKNSENTGIIN